MTSEPLKKPNPGSKKAVAEGCLCPVVDNHYGAGMQHEDGPRFWHNADCPMHGFGSLKLNP